MSDPSIPAPTPSGASIRASTNAPSSSEAPRRASFPMNEAQLATALQLARELGEAVAVENEKAERALLLHEAAEIEERVRGDELGAAKSYLAAFNSRPTFHPPLFGLIRLYSRRRSITNLAKLYEALIKAAPDEREKADAIVQRGELLEDRLDDPQGGRGAYEEAVVVDPGCRAALLALERHGLKEGDTELLRRSLAHLAQLTADPNRKARLLTELAWDHAREETPEALAEASRLLREAASLPMGRWRALIELERFAEKQARHEDLVFALEGRAALSMSVASGQEFQGGSGTFAIARLQDASTARDTAADLWARSARVRLASLNDPEGALSAMDQSLALKPDDVRFRVYAMYLAEQSGDLTRASAHAAWLLEREYGDATTRGALYFRLAEAAAAGGDLQGSERLLRQAFQTNGDSAATLGATIDQMISAGDGAGAAKEFDRLAMGEQDKTRKAALYRAAAMLSLALAGDLEGATTRFRFAAEEDARDAVSRRALVYLQSRPGLEVTAQSATALVQNVDELLPLVKDADERAALLLEKLRVLRFVAKDNAGAAQAAEDLARATDNEIWALEESLLLREASGAHALAAKLAEELAERTEGDARRDWSAAAARLYWAAGDETRARTLALAMHRDQAEDPYLTTLAFRLALAGGDPPAALDVLMRKVAAADDATATRWLLIGSVLLASAGAREPSRRALEHAAERTPGSAAVRAALLATTRWRADTALRTLLADAALDAPEAAEEEVALGVELVLAKVFLEHDMPAAVVSLERVVGRAEGNSLVVSLLNAIVLGSQHGPDAVETQDALQGVLSVLPANDPMRPAFELEVARALSSSSATADQGREVRELVEEEQQGSVAPRLLALLDAIQREERREVATALGRVADGADPQTATALRSAALATLRAQGRESDARAMAMTYPELPASAVALTEIDTGLDTASSLADGLAERVGIAVKEQRPGLERRAAVWNSLARRDEEAVRAAEIALKADPDDLASLDVLRLAGRRLERWSKVVEAALAMAERVKDPTRAARLWEEAGVLYLDMVNTPLKAEPALRQALEHDPRRVPAYRRLREVLERRKDFAGLEALVTTRIAATEERTELVELNWEQARLRRALGRREEALVSAEHVVQLEPEHVAALALVAEVHATSGRLAQAADALSRLAAAKETPQAQRKVARAGAIDIFELRLKEPSRALEQLDALYVEGEADDKAVERAVAIAQKADLWDFALRFAQRAADRARTPDARSRTLLRVAEINRDKLRDPAAALVAAQLAHDAFPSRLEALRAVHGLADEDERSRRARRTVEALRESIRGTGASPDLALAIEQAARFGGDLVLARAAQRLARALGGADVQVVSVGVPAGKPSLRDPGLALRYRDPEDAGTGIALLETVLPDMVELVGLTTDAFGVGRAERVRGANLVRTALIPYASAAGVPEFELYVGGNDDMRVAVIPGDPPAIVLGRKRVPPFDEVTRFALVRALLLAARGLAPLQVISPIEAGEIVLAALAAADLQIAGGTQRFESRLAPVRKALSRKARKAIAESGRQVAGGPDPLADVARGARAVVSTARRGALALSGSAAAALADLRAVDPTEPPRRDLSLFAVSDALTSIERESGVDRG